MVRGARGRVAFLRHLTPAHPHQGGDDGARVTHHVNRPAEGEHLQELGKDSHVERSLLADQPFVGGIGDGQEQALDQGAECGIDLGPRAINRDAAVRDGCQHFAPGLHDPRDTIELRTTKAIGVGIEDMLNQRGPAAGRPADEDEALALGRSPPGRKQTPEPSSQSVHDPLQCPVHSLRRMAVRRMDKCPLAFKRANDHCRLARARRSRSARYRFEGKVPRFNQRIHRLGWFGHNRGLHASRSCPAQGPENTRLKGHVSIRIDAILRRPRNQTVPRGEARNAGRGRVTPASRIGQALPADRLAPLPRR